MTPAMRVRVVPPEPVLAEIYPGPVVQWTERSASNGHVGGSTPPGPAMYGPVAQWPEPPADNRETKVRLLSGLPLSNAFSFQNIYTTVLTVSL